MRKKEPPRSSVTGGMASQVDSSKVLDMMEMHFLHYSLSEDGVNAILRWGERNIKE
jgi:hypothetical protein